MTTRINTSTSRKVRNGKTRIATANKVNELADFGGKHILYSFESDTKNNIKTIDFSSDILEYLVRQSKFEIIKPLTSVQ